MLEANLESSPQFILQLYVVAVQQEPVTIAQITSLRVSFLGLARASVVADEILHYDDRRNDGLNMKNKLLHFVTHLLVLSSRLFAAAFADYEPQYDVGVGFPYSRVQSLHSPSYM